MADLQKCLDLIRPAVRRRIANQHRARFDTSDIVQECAVQLIREFESRDSADGDPQQVSQTWLTRIGHGNMSRLLRRDRAKCRSVTREITTDQELSGHQSTPEDIAQQREISGELLMALSVLDKLESDVVERHYQHQQSLSSIARDLGLSCKQVQRIHQSIIKKLKSELSGQSGV